MAKAKTSKPQPKPAAKASPKAKPSAKPAAKSSSKPAAKPAAKPKAVPAKAVKPAAKAVAKPAAKPSSKPASGSVGKAAVKPVVKSKVPAPAAKPAAKVTAAAKSAGKPVGKPVAKAPLKPAAPVRKTSPAKSKGPIRPMPAPIEPPANGKHPFMSKADLEFFRKALLNLRDRYVDEIGFLTGDSLARNSRDSSGDLSNYSLHMADQGTDNFDREFALNLASGDQDILYEIDEALQRIDQNTYGICELTQQPINKERLKVIPYARYCTAAQSEMERGKTRYRPFGPTLSQL